MRLETNHASMDQFLHLPTRTAPTPAANNLLTVEHTEYAAVPLTAEMRWLETAIGRLVCSGIYLLGGQPGSRKSGLALQLGLDLARQNQSCLFVLNEEPSSRLKDRAALMTSGWSRAAAARAMRNVHVEQNLFDLEYLPAFVSQRVLSPAGDHHGIKLLVIDSIQGHGLPSGATGKYRKLFEAARLCQSAGITTLLIGHVTKRDQISGPRDLEHNVDVVMLLRKALGYRPLFVPKNRFGPSLLKPLPLDIDPETTRLSVSRHVRPSAGTACTYFGDGAGVTEVQASVSLPSFGNRGKMTSAGLPRREVEQLLACIGQVPGLDVDGLDLVINCRLPGERSYRPAMGLPLCMALIGSYLQREVPEGHLFLGEVDLCRNVRDLPPALIEDLRAAMASGELGSGGRLLCPRSASRLLPAGEGIEIVPIGTLDDAIRQTWPEVM